MTCVMHKWWIGSTGSSPGTWYTLFQLLERNILLMQCFWMVLWSQPFTPSFWLISSLSHHDFWWLVGGFGWMVGFYDGYCCSWQELWWTLAVLGCGLLNGYLVDWCLVARVSILFIPAVLLLWLWHIALAWLVTQLCVMCCWCTAAPWAVKLLWWNLSPGHAQVWSAVDPILVLSKFWTSTSVIDTGLTTGCWWFDY